MVDNKYNKVSFLLLSFFSGFLELGILFLAYKNNISILGIVFLALAYQIGNIVPNPLTLNKKITCVLSVISCVLAIILLIKFNIGIIFIYTIIAAMVIQQLRSHNKADIPTNIKRGFRVLGFLLSAFLNVVLIVVVSIIISVICKFEKFKSEKIQVYKPSLDIVSLLMIVHQIHYFSYCYIILIILLYSKISPLGVSCIFVLGWITYISISHFIKRGNYKKYFVIGHTFLSLVLLRLYFTDSLNEIIILWILTGFGGGTVFCIEKVNNTLSKSDIIFSENIGHILGVIITLCIIILGISLKITVLIAFICASTAAILMIIISISINRKRG